MLYGRSSSNSEWINYLPVSRNHCCSHWSESPASVAQMANMNFAPAQPSVDDGSEQNDSGEDRCSDRRFQQCHYPHVFEPVAAADDGDAACCYRQPLPGCHKCVGYGAEQQWCHGLKWESLWQNRCRSHCVGFGSLHELCGGGSCGGGCRSRRL